MGIPDDWLHSHLVHHKPKRKMYVADYTLFMLKNGYLVGIPVKSLDGVEDVGAELEELGFKKPRFAEAFTPINGVVVRMELHDKSTKAGKPMYRFYVKEDVTGTEHMIIAFEKHAFAKNDRVKVSMGQYGKQAERLDANNWDDEDDENGGSQDIPF